MGFFSWQCAVCDKSIMNRYTDRPPKECAAVMVTPDAAHHEPSYEGYGDFGGVDAYGWVGDGDRDKGINTALGEDCPPDREIKIVHEHCYTGQQYADLPKSKDCPNQGYFED